VAKLAPEELRRRQLAAFTAWVLAGARSQPVALAFEDLHWADPTTLDLMQAVAERGAQVPLLILATTRPDFRPPWSLRPHHSVISLSPLDRADVEQMISELASRHALSKEVIESVSVRTGGVPLFVEEVTRLLLERGEEGSARAIPPTLQQSLVARLDRLGPAREVAQIGAVIGRDFPYALLRAVAGMDDTPLQAALDRLADANILLVQGLPPDADYRFKHALIQDAAYENLLKSRRQVLHRRVGEALRDKFAGAVGTEPELLAHHFTQAGMTETAIEWWGRAGRRSLERSALVEAIAQLTRALDQIATLPATPELRRERIKLQVALIAPLIHVKGYAAPETKAAAEWARLLIEQGDALGEIPEDPLQLFTVLFGLTTASIVAFNGDVARDLSAHFLELAEKQRASFPRVVGHNLLGASSLYAGDIAEGRAHLDQGNALYDPAEHRALATRFGEDHGVGNLSLRALALWMLGYPDAALADADQALRDAREVGHAVTLMFALGFVPLTRIQCGDYAAANAETYELVALADEKDAALWKAIGMLERGWLLGETGRASDAVQMLTSWITATRSTGATLWEPLWLLTLSRAYAELGQLDDAWRCMGEAMIAVETTGEKLWEAEANRIAGEIALKSPQPDAEKAEANFERALAVARQQQAKSFELRAAMSLARLWRDLGKWQQARELLAPVYGWFTEGFDTRDLKEAKVLLDELAA
jgi:predicted ATPase